MAELNQSPEKAGGKVRGKRLSTRVDLTAMVDLAFLLVTFFMLTTSLNKPHLMKITMPDRSDSTQVTETPASRTLTVCIGTDNRAMWYMGTPDEPLTEQAVSNYSTRDLRKAIIENQLSVKQRSGKDLIVLVKPSDHSKYDDLVNTVDELNITQVPSYAIVDISRKDIDMMKQKGVY